MKKSVQETAKNFLFCDTQAPGTIPNGWNWEIWNTGKANSVSDFCSFDSRNPEVKWIILFIIYKQVSPGTSRVEVEVFRSTHSILLLAVSAGFQSYGTETQMSQAPGLLWDNSPILSKVEGICHNRQILMAQLAVEWICIKFSNPSMDPKILFSCL